jgi:hypothetical protein
MKATVFTGDDILGTLSHSFVYGMFLLDFVPDRVSGFLYTSASS